MPILEVCAFRSNKLVGHNVVSPIREFTWDSQVVWAGDCDSGCKNDEYGHLIPRRFCTCGIYATLVPSEIYTYMNYLKDDGILFLVEAIGQYVVHYTGASEGHHDTRGGFRASGVQIAAVVDFQPSGKIIGADTTFYTKKAMRLAAMAKKYDVDVIPLDVAIEIAKIKWEEHNPEFPWAFDLSEERLRDTR